MAAHEGCWIAGAALSSRVLQQGDGVRRAPAVRARRRRGGEARRTRRSRRRSRPGQPVVCADGRANRLRARLEGNAGRGRGHAARVLVDASGDGARRRQADGSRDVRQARPFVSPQWPGALSVRLGSRHRRRCCGAPRVPARGGGRERTANRSGRGRRQQGHEFACAVRRPGVGLPRAGRARAGTSRL